MEPQKGFLLKTRQNEMEAAASASTVPDKITTMLFHSFQEGSVFSAFPNVAVLVTLALRKRATLAMNASDRASRAPHLQGMCVFVTLFENDPSRCCRNEGRFIVPYCSSSNLRPSTSEMLSADFRAKVLRLK